MVSELNLNLQCSKLHCIVLPHRVGAVQNGFPGLLVEQVQLDGIPGVNVGVAVEVLSLQEQNLGLDNALLAQSLAMINPIDYMKK